MSETPIYDALQREYRQRRFIAAGAALAKTMEDMRKACQEVLIAVSRQYASLNTFASPSRKPLQSKDS